MNVVRLTVAELNAIANQPEVRVSINPFMPDSETMDLSWVYRRGGIVLGVEGLNGACLFIPRDKGRWEAHFLMNTPGALRAIKAIFDWMFTNTTARAIFGFTARHNLAARLACRWLGCSAVGAHINEAGQPCIGYELTRDKWHGFSSRRV